MLSKRRCACAEWAWCRGRAQRTAPNHPQFAHCGDDRQAGLVGRAQETKRIKRVKAEGTAEPEQARCAFKPQLMCRSDHDPGCVRLSASQPAGAPGHASPRVIWAQARHTFKCTVLCTVAAQCQEGLIKPLLEGLRQPWAPSPPVSRAAQVKLMMCGRHVGPCSHLIEAGLEPYLVPAMAAPDCTCSCCSRRWRCRFTASKKPVRGDCQG